MDIISIAAGKAIVELSAEDAAILVKACTEALTDGQEFIARGNEDPVDKGHYLQALRAALSAVSIGCVAQTYVLGKDLGDEANVLARLGFERESGWKPRIR